VDAVRYLFALEVEAPAPAEKSEPRATDSGGER
jgi:hypothetical protein